jgi:hypothetical protein
MQCPTASPKRSLAEYPYIAATPLWSCARSACGRAAVNGNAECSNCRVTGSERRRAEPQRPAGQTHFHVRDAVRHDGEMKSTSKFTRSTERVRTKPMFAANVAPPTVGCRMLCAGLHVARARSTDKHDCVVQRAVVAVLRVESEDHGHRLHVPESRAGVHSTAGRGPKQQHKTPSVERCRPHRCNQRTAWPC